MSRLDRLLEAYAEHIASPWQQGLSGSEKVIFLVYTPSDELRLRIYIDEFELRTREAGHGWHHIDLTNAFPQWMANHRRRDKYFARPELLSGHAEGKLTEFTRHLVEQVRAGVAAQPADSVVALSGTGTLFGVSSVSELVEKAAASIQGRLVVFFPGDVDNDNYRLLDARDGWNYMAHAITGA